MKIIAQTGRDDIAMVYLAEMRQDRYIEFVQSLQPPFSRQEKWVFIVSTLYGCPVGCRICDAGGWYQGKLTAGEIFAQTDYLVDTYFPNREVPVKKFKIQFARMGEPSMNAAVLDVLEQMPQRYHAPGLMPSISTVAPNGSESFFEKLLPIKDKYYGGGNFQLQFSIHSSDPVVRDQWIPVPKWSFAQIAQYGKQFFKEGDRKITLNFALAHDSVLTAGEMLSHFDPALFVIKLTPVNPTLRAIDNRVTNAVENEEQANQLQAVQDLRSHGYEVIVSIGELEENKIGSNCGQYVKTFLDHNRQIPHDSYRYPLANVH